MPLFGPKYGQDLENRATHPYQEVTTRSLRALKKLYREIHQNSNSESCQKIG